MVQNSLEGVGLEKCRYKVIRYSYNSHTKIIEGEHTTFFHAVKEIETMESLIDCNYYQITYYIVKDSWYDSAFKISGGMSGKMLIRDMLYSMKEYWEDV